MIGIKNGASEAPMTPSDKAAELADAGKAVENTDREIWREREGDYYADSIHVTKGGGVGINCGGYVFVKPLRDWFELAGGKSSFLPGLGSAAALSMQEANAMPGRNALETNVNEFAAELRKWWSFNDRQQHTHSWHSREDFIERVLPLLLENYNIYQNSRPVPAPQPDMERARTALNEIHARIGKVEPDKSKDDDLLYLLYDLDKLARHAFTALPAQERTWQPIETAPAYSTPEVRVWVLGGRYTVPAVVVPDGEYWRATKGELKMIPTHWAPCDPPQSLPAPPHVAEK